MRSVFVALLLAAPCVWSQGVCRDATCDADKRVPDLGSGGKSLLQKKKAQGSTRNSRNLLVFFDGTGCNMNKTCDFHEGHFCESSIVDLYRQTSGVNDNQLTQYMGGVGTDDIGYSRVSQTLDKATGESVNMRAEIIYRWIVETYQPGDKIFAFGHSRGCISARVLQGMINLLGVARPSHLDEAIQAFYEFDESIPLAFKASKKAWPDSGTVEFLGLFEGVLRTVIATKNIENLKQTISPAVKTFAHAMGLGEWRRVYEVNELVVTEHTKATQVWFMGQHGNIGGNVESNGVNDIPKAWMIDQAMASGMMMPNDWEARLNIDAQGDVRTDREVTGIDSTGWGFRNPGYCRQAAGFGDAPIKIHQSVKDRMSLVPGWVPPQWCCGTYDFVEKVQWVSNSAYDHAKQSPAASKPHWVRVVLGELKNAKTRKTTPKWYARVQMWLRAGASLPNVETMLSKASDKVQDFAAKAAAMQTHVAKKQEQKRKALAAKKASYEHMLEEQAAENSAVVEAIEDIRNEIGTLKLGVSKLEEDARNLEQDNKVMHGAISSLRHKAVAANSFLNNSLHATDDSQAAALLVLEPPKPKPTLSHFLAVATGGPSTRARSALLQLHSRAKASRSIGEPRAEDLVPVLSRGLADLASADLEGDMYLKKSFLAAWERGEKRRGELNATQEMLIAERASLDSHRAALLSAKAHLLETRRQLQQRLQGMRVFAQRISSTIATTLKRVGAASTAAVPATPAPDVDASSKQNIPAEATETAQLNVSGKNATKLLQTGTTPQRGLPGLGKIWSIWR